MERWSVKPHLGSLEAARAGARDLAPDKLPFAGNDLAWPEIATIDTLIRVRGVLTIPADGDYRFAIAGDDLAELYLATDALPVGKRRVSDLSSYTGPDDWNPSKSHRIGEPISLKKGQQCYVEAWCFNQGGKGRFEVGWLAPGSAKFARIPLKAADGSLLLRKYEVPANDADDDELPDDWERAKGLEIGKDPLQGADGDPDGDGISNREEFLAGTDPRQGDSLAGAVRTEIWPSRGDTGLEQQFRFGVQRLPLPAPQRRIERTIAVTPFALPGFQRTRALLIPPASGTYRFHLSGQGVVSLDLAPDGDLLNKRQILRGGDVRERIDPARIPPGAYPSSGPVILEHDAPCFLELVLYQYAGPYFLNLEWTRPDGVREPVPMSALKSYVSPFPDADQDDLPDAWEREKQLAVDGQKFAHFASGDPDFDGADNAAEYLAKTDPLKADTDGDGVSDGDEIVTLGTDPLNGEAPLGEPVKLDLFSATALTPGWARTEPGTYESFRKLEGPMPDPNKPSLSNFRGCGTLEWKFEVKEEGFHLLRLQIQPVSQYSTHEIGQVSQFWIDGQRLPDVSTWGHAVALQAVSQVTPKLGKGEHVLRLRLRPAYVATFTRIFDIRIDPVKASQTEFVASHLRPFNLFASSSASPANPPDKSPAPVLARVGSGTPVGALPEGVEIDGGEVARIEQDSAGKTFIVPLMPGSFALPLRAKGGGASAVSLPLQAFKIQYADEVYWGGRQGQTALGRALHLVVDDAPADAVIRVTCREPDRFLPFTVKSGNSVDLPVKAIGPDGQATLHFRSLKNASDWLRVDVELVMPDGRRF